jgi:hypothetical protein
MKRLRRRQARRCVACVSTAEGDGVESGLSHGRSRAVEVGLERWDRRRSRQLMTGEAFDDEHGLGAERALDLSCGSRLWWWRSCLQQEAATQQRCGPFTVGEEAEVADANQAFGQNVDEKSSQELIG